MLTRNGKKYFGSIAVHDFAKNNNNANIVLCGDNKKDIEESMIYGISGLLNTQYEENKCVYNEENEIIEWQNGAKAIFSFTPKNIVD